MNKFMGHKMKRRMEGSGVRKGGPESSVEDFYCLDTRDAHKSTGKIQLSIICSDLIAMVTEQWKILIKPALATGRKMGERREKAKTETECWWREREDKGIVCVCVWFQPVLSRIPKFTDCPHHGLTSAN